MFHLLQMDLYRLRRTRAVYICLAVLLAATALCYWIVWMITTPEGKSFAAQIGMTGLENLDSPGTILKEYNTLSMFREVGMDGGGYSCLLGILISLFVCSDFSSGFAKNIMSLHRDRRVYIGSKLLAAGILNFIIILIQFGFSLLLNLLCGSLFPMAKPGDTLFYLTWAWLLTTAFAALIILICTLIRSVSAGLNAAWLLGSGILIMMLSYITGLFNANDWVPYTLYYNISYGPSAYGGLRDLKIYVIGLIFLAAYSAGAAAAISRKDI